MRISPIASVDGAGSPQRGRFVIVPSGGGHVKRYRKAADVIRTDGDRSFLRPPSLWDRDLWAEDHFEHAETESTATAS